MAMLIQSLAVAGARRSDGSAAASGFVYLYSPGTTSPVSGYRDNALSQTWPTTNGGIQLDAGGRASIWVNQKVDLAVYDSSGALVLSIVGFNGVPAAVVEVQNAGYTGAITDPATGAVTQGAGGLTDLNTLLTRATSSFGGLDFQFLESPGGTNRNVSDALREIWISVKDFGATGLGLSDDTNAIQAAVNRVAALGGGVVYFPPGTYKTNAAISGQNITGIRLVGAGVGSSIIKGTNGAQDGFAFTSCTDISFENINVQHTGLSTGKAYNLTSCVLVRFGRAWSDSVTNSQALNGFYRYGYYLTSCKQVTIIDPGVSTASGDASSVALFAASTNYTRAIGGYFYCPSGVAQAEFSGTTGNFIGIGVQGLAGSKWDSGLTGTYFVLVGCGDSVSPSNPNVATAADPDIRLFGCNAAAVNLFANVGNSLTPTRQNGVPIELSATGGGAGTMTVTAPTPPPASSAQGVYMTIWFRNSSGGAVTWSLDASFKVNAAIPTTDGQSTIVTFLWTLVGVTNTWREVSRAQTAS